MISINHNLKAIYVHIPKTGGLYVEHILTNVYDFVKLYPTDLNDKFYNLLNFNINHIKKEPDFDDKVEKQNENPIDKPIEKDEKEYFD